MTNNTQASQQVPNGIGESNPLTRFSYEESTRWLLRIYGQIEQLESENRQLRAALAAQPQAGGDGAKDAELLNRLLTNAEDYMQGLEALRWKASHVGNSDKRIYWETRKEELQKIVNDAAIAAGKHKGE